jgi:putative ABC transport system permease protein
VQWGRGITGRLARENAMRNPRRTSGSAGALLIGVSVVVLFTVFAASIKSSINDQIERSFGGDLVVDSGNIGVSGFNPRFAEDARALPEVEEATGLRFGAMNIADDDKFVAVIDPETVTGVFDLDVAEGRIEDLGERQVAISDEIADDKGYRIGTTLPGRFPDGFRTELTVVAIYRSQDVAGNWTIGTPAWSPHAHDNVDAFVMVNVADGVPLERAKAAVARLAEAYPGAEVQDRQEFADTQAGFVNMLLGLVYTLLTLAIIIALLGIANTLSLSIFERTRELGLLRAVGMTRGQLRSAVRWESVMIATFGAVGGLGLGVFLGWALVRGAGRGGFTTVTIPYGSLLAVLLLAGVCGVLAGLMAARKAARLDVLQAIATE